LYSLAEKGIKGDLRESFGFQQLPAIFAGLHPEGSESGHALFVYDPENSPFKDIEELKFKKYLKMSLQKHCSRIPDH